ncbi:hypothetical protein [Nostoc sp. C117]
MGVYLGDSGELGTPPNFVASQGDSETHSNPVVLVEKHWEY